jgi:alpha-beta hydrolase superfamily lysophospholipase
MAKRLFIIIGILILSPVLYFTGLSFTGSSRPDQADLISASGSEDQASQWIKRDRTARLRGVAVVVHGLNLKPERMQAVIAELNRAGIDVLNVSLKGHGRNFAWNGAIPMDEARLESFRNVTYRLWLDEVRGAYLKARQRAAEKKVPLFFVGYSLGGLMGCNLLLADPYVAYDRLILFAPALSMTAESYLLKPLMPFPNLVIDSLSPVSYRSNDGTPMAAYRAVFDAVEYFHNNVDPRLTIPTAVFVDEKDEFISTSRLQETVARRNLDRWRIHWVQKGPDGSESLSHHLLIDEAGVGRDTWRQMTAVLKQHVSMKD